MDKIIEEKLDQIFSGFKTKDKPGVIVGITRNGNMEYTKAFGMANLEYGIPLSLDSVLQVGSVTKQFTAFAVLLLVKAGKIDPDAPVRQYLDYFPEFEHTITVRHMVHHVSGLRSNIAFQMINGIGMEDIFTQELSLIMTAKQKALNFKPDTFYMYNNLAYCLLAEIVAVVTGKSFRQFLDETIFEPLGMTHSFIHDKNFELIKNRAEAYRCSNEEVANYPILQSEYGSTNLFTTVGDMMKWAEELLNPQVFPKGIVATAFLPHVCKNGYKTGYGFGLELDAYKGVERVRHGGADSGYRALIQLIPDRHLGVVFLSNSADFLPEEYGKKVLDITLDLPDDGSNYEKVDGDTDMSGTYYIEKSAAVYPIAKTEDGTFLTAMGMKMEIFEKTDGTLAVPRLDIEMSVSQTGELSIHDNGNILNCTRIKRVPLEPGDRSVAGKYIGIEFDSVHDVVVTNDQLILCNNKIGKIPFLKYDNGMFFSMVVPETIPNIKFENDRMYISVPRALNVEFIRI
ncbi:MAG: beta-lactamase family protein [Desulfobacteraceae bacterium]|nr:beta-lactamase family protein [Desulfobacteraceae bacterium]